MSIKDSDLQNPDSRQSLTVVERAEEPPNASVISSTSGISAAPRNLSLVQPGTIIEGNPHYEEIYRCITYNDVSSLRLMLNRYTDPVSGEQEEINLIGMRDARKFTVLSYSCYKNNEECFMILYDHALANNMRGVKSFEDK